jgi:hypothetical protein
MTKVWLVKSTATHNRAWMRPIGREIRTARNVSRYVDRNFGETTARVVNGRLNRNDLRGLADILWSQGRRS